MTLTRASGPGGIARAHAGRRRKIFSIRGKTRSDTEHGAQKNRAKSFLHGFLRYINCLQHNEFSAAKTKKSLFRRPYCLTTLMIGGVLWLDKKRGPSGDKNGGAEVRHKVLRGHWRRMAFGYPSIKLLRRLPSPARDDFERGLR